MPELRRPRINGAWPIIPTAASPKPNGWHPTTILPDPAIEQCSTLVCQRRAAPDCLGVYVSAVQQSQSTRYVCQRCRAHLGMVPLPEFRRLGGRGG